MNTENKKEHISVMLLETIEALNIKKDGIYVDGTFGLGGHSRAILKKLGKGGRVIAIDRDLNAKQHAEGLENLTLIHDSFSNILEHCQQVDGILLDFGVSSPQLDEAERGFSFRFDNAKLDMRMNQKQELTAATVVNTYPQKKLEYIIRKYGEEKFATNIARNIVEARALKPIKTVGELKAIIDKSIPLKVTYRHGKKDNPYQRTFQAIRIEVNAELEEIEKVLVDGFKALKVGGRMVTLTFHSLEDRLVKDYFAELTTGCTCDKRNPVCVCNNRPCASYPKGKFVKPSNQEIKENPRSRSAIMRVIEKLEER